MARPDLAQSVKGMPTTAEKIRALAARGLPRAEIARALGIRYQHVRNVLMREEARAAKLEEAARSSDASTTSGKIRIGADGRAAVPATFTAALGLKPGDLLFVRLSDGEIQLLTRKAITRRVQAAVREFVPEGVSLVDELIEDRRREVEAEAENG